MTQSYIISSKKTGKAIFETFDKSVADKVNRENYHVLTALEYLQKFNKELREENKT